MPRQIQWLHRDVQMRGKQKLAYLQAFILLQDLLSHHQVLHLREHVHQCGHRLHTPVHTSIIVCEYWGQPPSPNTYSTVCIFILLLVHRFNPLPPKMHIYKYICLWYISKSKTMTPTQCSLSFSFQFFEWQLFKIVKIYDPNIWSNMINQKTAKTQDPPFPPTKR